MNTLFENFGISFDQLSALSLNAVTVDTNLPPTFSELRRVHIEDIIRELQPAEENGAIRNKLHGLLIPKKIFNPNGLLLHNIFRMFEYTWNNNAMLI